MRHALSRLGDGAAAIGFALFAMLLVGLAVLLLANGSLSGLLPAVIGTASAAAALETWTGRRFRWRPAVVVGLFVVAFVVIAVIALQNIGP